MPHPNEWLLYGCYGYTGKLIAKHAVTSGMRPTLAGRDEQKVKQLADDLQLPYKVFDVKNIDEVATHLHGFALVLHCAGPFIFTSEIMVQACLQAKVHYLDITGEYQVFERIFELDAEAKKNNVMLLPGVGFDVVPSDCLSAQLKAVLPSASTLELVLMNKGGGLSQGTALTIAENMGTGTVVRKRGKLETVRNGEVTIDFSLDGKPKTAVAISWGDVSTAYRSTAIPSITVYNLLPPQVVRSFKMSNSFGFILRSSIMKKFMRSRIKSRPPGPTDQMRESASSAIWGQASNHLGISKRMLLLLPEGYTLTYLTAVEVVKQVLSGNFKTGAHTPSQVYGKDFILGFPKVELKVLE